MRQSIPDFEKISKTFHQIVAAFFLVFALTDLMVVDVLFPNHCIGDMFGLQDVARASSVSPTNEDTLLPNIESLLPSSDKQSSTFPEIDDDCCFCYCTHLLLNKIIFIALPYTISSTSELHSHSQLSAPHQSIFHPPRLI